ncbi:MAG: Transcriptional regulator, LysR family [uncultured Paraburkholderia sp.]|nr:MAG: Transcriptional regulator, LysR family [uncultured Paraburkholderia sp.]
MDKFVSMEIFVAVVEAGSLTAAAERFDISSAMVASTSVRSKAGSARTSSRAPRAGRA